MSLLFCDSFDHYATGDFLQKWSSVNSVGAITAGAGRRGTNSLRATATNNNHDKTIAATVTGVLGVAFKTVGGLPSSAGNIIEFRDGATRHVAIQLNPDGTITALRNTTALGTSTNSIVDGTYYYLEVKVTIDDAAGVVEVRVNGSSSGWLNLTSQDTRNAGNASFNVIRLNAPVASTDIDFDDLYLLDTTGGAPNNNFLGDVRVDFYAVTGNGAVNEFARSGGSANYEMVDDPTPDGDTTYIYQSLPNRKDLYQIADMGHTPVSIFGVQGVNSARKSDAGNRQHRALMRSGSTVYDGPVTELSTSYLMYTDMRQVDPDTAAAWTSGGVNALQVGAGVD
jgi:hypothetical protein